jgi:hypothetical protein
VSASAKPTSLVMPTTRTNGVTPRRSQAQNVKDAAISSSNRVVRPRSLLTVALQLLRHLLLVELLIRRALEW